jgi:CheY-like chemotaxis protein
VLVVDDEELVGLALSRLLSPEHDVSAVSSAEEALALIRAGRRFDLLLCDLMMPGASGIDLFEHLSAIAPDQAGKVVFMTGGAFTPKAGAFLETVSNRKLRKPLDPASLYALLSEYAPAT